jgi:hypothetical protein
LRNPAAPNRKLSDEHNSQESADDSSDEESARPERVTDHGAHRGTNPSNNPHEQEQPDFPHYCVLFGVVGVWVLIAFPLGAACCRTVHAER